MRSYLFSTFFLGLSMTLIGIFVLINPTTSLTAVTLIIGILLILNGVNEIVGYLRQAKIWNISKWHLVEGLLALAFGVATFFYTDVAQQIFVIIFAVWLLISAISHIFISRKLDFIPGAGWLTVFGVLLLIIAIGSLFTQMFAAITIATFIGIIFLAQGFMWLSLWGIIRRYNK